MLGGRHIPSNPCCGMLKSVRHYLSNGQSLISEELDIANKPFVLHSVGVTNLIALNMHYTLAYLYSVCTALKYSEDKYTGIVCYESELGLLWFFLKNHELLFYYITFDKNSLKSFNSLFVIP